MIEGFWINKGEDFLNQSFKKSIEENYMKGVTKMEEYILGKKPPEDLDDLVCEMTEANKAVREFVRNLKSMDGVVLENIQLEELYQSNRYHLFDNGQGDCFIARGKEILTDGNI